MMASETQLLFSSVHLQPSIVYSERRFTNFNAKSLKVPHPFPCGFTEAWKHKKAALPKDNKMEATENCYQEIAMVAHK
jgi:hypothetical protein